MVGMHRRLILLQTTFTNARSVKRIQEVDLTIRMDSWTGFWRALDMIVRT